MNFYKWFFGVKSTESKIKETEVEIEQERPKYYIKFVIVKY